MKRKLAVFALSVVIAFVTFPLVACVTAEPVDASVVVCGHAREPEVELDVAGATGKPRHYKGEVIKVDDTHFYIKSGKREYKFKGLYFNGYKLLEYLEGYRVEVTVEKIFLYNKPDADKYWAKNASWFYGWRATDVRVLEKPKPKLKPEPELSIAKKEPRVKEYELVGVDIDGYLYLLSASGRIFKWFGGYYYGLEGLEQLVGSRVEVTREYIFEKHKSGADQKGAKDNPKFYSYKITDVRVLERAERPKQS